MTAPVAALHDHELIELLCDDPDLLAIADAIAATAPRRTRSSRTIVALGAAIVCAAGVLVAPAFGISLGIINFWTAPHAPKSAQSTFAQRGLVLPESTLRGLNLAQTRGIAVEEFAGGAERLFVAPRAGGGFCYEWAEEPGDPGTWVDELGGCANRSQPLFLAYDDSRVSIVLDRRFADGARVTLTNGRVVQPALKWVSAPVSAGFLLYQPPNGLHVLSVEAVKGGNVVAFDPINQRMFDTGTR